jgi:nucleotide-binding universal stress UspA family protein
MADVTGVKGAGTPHSATALSASDETDGFTGVKALVILDPKISSEAIDRVAKFACSGVAGCKVYVKYVVDMDPIAGLHFHDAHFDLMRKDGREMVDVQASRLRDSGVEVEVLPSHFGMAAEEILRVEEQIRPDVIVVRAPRSPLIRRLLPRDFREEVVQKASAPVLTVRSRRDVRPRHHLGGAARHYANARVG